VLELSEESRNEVRAGDSKGTEDGPRAVQLKRSGASD